MPSGTKSLQFSGLLLFTGGMLMHIKSDGILQRLRRRNEKGYKIPRGFLFESVTAPNYLGECLEWVGFAIFAWSLPAFAHAAFVISLLLPRALQYHRLLNLLLIWTGADYVEMTQQYFVIIGGTWTNTTTIQRTEKQLFLCYCNKALLFYQVISYTQTHSQVPEQITSYKCPVSDCQSWLNL